VDAKHAELKPPEEEIIPEGFEAGDPKNWYPRASTPEWMHDDFVPLEEPGEDSSSEISYYSVDFNM
jgi:hypothetical protein